MHAHIHATPRSYKTNHPRRERDGQEAWRHTLCKQTRSIKFPYASSSVETLNGWGSCSEMCIWKINTPHNAFIMTSVHSCVPNIFKHASHVWNILSRMCAIAGFSDGRLLHIVWNVIRIHSMFFPSVMVQLRWINWGRVSWFVCLWDSF